MYPRSYIIFFCVVPTIALTYGAVMGVTAISKHGALTPLGASVLIGTSVACAMFLGYFFGRPIR